MGRVGAKLRSRPRSSKWYQWQAAEQQRKPPSGTNRFCSTCKWPCVPSVTTLGRRDNAKSAATRGQANSEVAPAVAVCSISHHSWQEGSLSTSIIVKSLQGFVKEDLQIRVSRSQSGHSLVNGPRRVPSISASQEKIMHRSQCQIG